MDRHSIAQLIVDKIKLEKESLKVQYKNSNSKIGYFYIDNLLPVEITEHINDIFPQSGKMSLKKSLRENKYVAAQMDQYNPVLEEAIYAFQDPKVVGIISEICEVQDLYPDENLYAGGISLMNKDQFLNPHLDNSHDKERDRWRVFNLLFYVTPDWSTSDGGHLELWPDGLDHPQITIESRFNRLIVMATHQLSWHSVSPVCSDKAARKCVSNYYFSDAPLQSSDTFHVTTFRGRPDQFIVDQILKLDSFLRMNIRKLFKKGIVENPHVYKKK